jgi:hypothetical protein
MLILTLWQKCHSDSVITDNIRLATDSIHINTWSSLSGIGGFEMSHNYAMQAIHFSSFALLESRVSPALVNFLWGASSGTACIQGDFENCADILTTGRTPQ